MSAASSSGKEVSTGVASGTAQNSCWSDSDNDEDMMRALEIVEKRQLAKAGSIVLPPAFPTGDKDRNECMAALCDAIGPTLTQLKSEIGARQMRSGASSAVNGSHVDVPDRAAALDNKAVSASADASSELQGPDARSLPIPDFASRKRRRVE